MAELSIVGFVLGSLSFGVTLRNGIERVLQDVDAYKAQIEVLVPLSSRLAVQSIHLESWRLFWRIDDGTPLELFSSYWGASGSEQIRRLLSLAYNQFENVNTEFESKYGHQTRDRIPNQGTHNKETERESLENLTQSLTRSRSRWRRVNTALFTGPIFQRHLEILEKSISLLHELSEKRFVENVCAYKDKDWKSHVEHTATRSYLIHLADQSTRASQALGALVETSGDHNIDFHLDHGAYPDQRQQVIIESARKCYIPYYFSVSPRQGTLGISGLKIQCQEATHSSFSDVAWDQNLPHALRKLCHSGNHPDGVSSYIRTAENAPGFIISSHQCPEHGSENLRTFMISNKSQHDRRLQGEFTKTERTKLAYELVECALLFLRTEWFSKLCSCSIYRLESNDLKPVHTVRMRRLHHSDHVDVESGKPCSQTIWCEQELVNMHIRRLGVLLVEIAVGAPVIEVAFNHAENDVELDFDAKGDNTNTAKRKDILRKVRRESSEDFMDAVGYCLKQGTAPGDMVKADLEAFYDHVVEP
ncbi:MAG: hypothetical protein L6R40_006141 [Gallowayella cf. fulva]|nr:MAG: hypothetical protein L6R40_006141 [Xanthomendoza cf. fulva]